MRKTARGLKLLASLAFENSVENLVRNVENMSEDKWSLLSPSSPLSDGGSGNGDGDINRVHGM